MLERFGSRGGEDYNRALELTLKRAEGWPAELYDLEADPHEMRHLLEDAAYQDRRKVSQQEMRIF